MRTPSARWPARPHWSRAASAGPPPAAWPRSAPASASPAGTKRVPKDAARQIARESGNPAVDAFASDMSCQAQVRKLAAAVLTTYPQLDVLVSNVGGFWATRHLTADGLKRTFAVNHLAAFLLTGLLLDRLKASAPARIVTVSSGAHATGTLNFGDLQREHSYSGQ
ncbi:MAG: SDR family NAD(P)-dependent oxidoreductase [Streptosporangiaceae bacterium]